MREMALITSKGAPTFPQSDARHRHQVVQRNRERAQWDQEPNQSGRGTCFSGGVPPCGPSGDDRQQKTGRQRTTITHEDLGGGHVPPQEPQQTASQNRRKRCHEPLAVQGRGASKRERRHESKPPRQAVHVVNEIDRVGDGHNPKQRNHHRDTRTGKLQHRSSAPEDGQSRGQTLHHQLDRSRKSSTIIQEPQGQEQETAQRNGSGCGTPLQNPILVFKQATGKTSQHQARHQSQEPQSQQRERRERQTADVGHVTKDFDVPSVPSGVQSATTAGPRNQPPERDQRQQSRAKCQPHQRPGWRFCSRLQHGDIVRVPMQRLAVYCASSDRIDDALRLPAQSLGAALAQRGLELVYGGGSIGLMGEVARAAKANGGRVHGVITERLRDLEQGWEEADVLEVVPDMRTRKSRMIELADGFVVLSGGIGTWEEFFEVLVGRLLGEHSGPIGLLRDGPMNEALLELIERGTTLGFVRPVTQELVQVHEDPNALLDAMQASHANAVDDADLRPGGRD